MKNCTMELTGNILTITVDVSKDFGRSFSGAATRVIIASTEVCVSIPDKDDIRIGLNVFKKA